MLPFHHFIINVGGRKCSQTVFPGSIGLCWCGRMKWTQLLTTIIVASNTTSNNSVMQLSMDRIFAFYTWYEWPNSRLMCLWMYLFINRTRVRSFAMSPTNWYCWDLIDVTLAVKPTQDFSVMLLMSIILLLKKVLARSWQQLTASQCLAVLNYFVKSLVRLSRICLIS